MELSIDTSTSIASIALSERGELLAEVTWHAGRNHTVELVPRIRQLLEDHGKVTADVRAVIVAKGPGSFNGLRVALATAKGLAVALGVPLVAVGTLEMLAYPHAASGLPVRPILQAGRGEIASATFQTKDGRWSQLVAEHVTTIDALCLGTREQTVLCGEISPQQIAHIEDSTPGLAIISPATIETRRAGYLAELGWCRIGAGEFDSPSTLQPLYLKKPSITTPKRRKYDAMSNMRARTQ